jgi:tripartite-type tricarboxylate transporter receptor subunit TctC
MGVDFARGGFVALALGLCAGLGAEPALADPIEDFYKNKSIDLVIGYTPGGSYDLYARLVGRFLGDFIPGKPRIVVRNMPGGGSRVAASYVYNVAPKDGTVIATGDQSLSVEQAMGDKTLTIDVNKFQYIGSPITENNTTVTWYTSGVKTIDDAKTKEVPMGATGGSTSSQYPKAMNAILGTKFKIIAGYPGGNDVSLAMEKGEVMGRGSNAWGAWKATRPDWLREKKITILVQIGLKKAPDLPDVPLLMDLATNDADHAVLKLLSASGAIGRPLFVAPGVPAERVAALRDAFDRMVKSPAFLEAAKAERFDVDPVPGEELQRIVADIVATPKPIADRLTQIIGGIEQNTR